MKSLFFLSKILIAFCLIVITSCEKNKISSFIETETKTQNVIIPYTFDWETADFMPTPAGITVRVPWASGENQSFPLEYGLDIRKADGWELVYNTFNPDTYESPAYFILYNRYRGVLKGFLYLTANTPIASSYVSHTLEQNTLSNVNVLTYTGVESTDLSITNTSATTVQPYRTPATGTWYAQEFEMAYDPQVGGKNASGNQFRWIVNSVNVTDALLNGVSQGEVKGTISTPARPFDLFNSLSTFVFQAGTATSVATFGFTGPVALALQSAISSGLNGSIRNITNGIFADLPSSGNGGSTQYVNLTTDVNYSFIGSLTNTSEIARPSMVIPGSAGQNDVAGYTPLYKQPLGLMSLSTSPTASFSTRMGRDGLDLYTLMFNLEEYTIQWNPTIINSSENGASIQNVTTQILSYEDYYDNNYTNRVVPFTGPNVESGTRPFYNDALRPNNSIAFRAFFSGNSESNNYSITWEDMQVGQPLPKHVLRITFDVVPNNGASRITIAKSFKIILKEWITLPQVNF